MKKIKICFISRPAYTLFNPKYNKKFGATFGGVEVDLYSIARELAKDPLFEISFIVGDFGQKEEEIINKVKLYQSYRLNENKIISILKLITIAKKINADIYFMEGAHGMNGIIRWISHKINKKFVYRTGSDIDCNKTFIRKNFIEGILYKYSLENADLVLTQNKINKIELQNNHNVSSIIIKNTIQLHKNVQKSTKRFILWVARSEKLKRPDLFVQLSKLLPKEKFLMICPKANSNSIDLDKFKKDIQGINNLKLINFIPLLKINKYFNQAKIFINTSNYEGFPNTFVQAMANGVPIVSLNVNPDNFLKNYKCGFCVKGDFELMKKRVQELLSNKKLYSQMSKNAYNYAKQNHDLKKIIKQYKEIFSDLIENDASNL